MASLIKGIPVILYEKTRTGTDAFNAPVYMDFNRDYMMEHGIGRYSVLDLPDDLNLFIAYPLCRSPGEG